MLSTECGYDYVSVYDGNSTFATQLGRFCTLPNDNLTSTENSLLITFSTDGSVTSSGFFASYEILKSKYIFKMQ